MNKSYAKIFENNQTWIETRLKQDPEYFQRLAEGQNPDYLYIGCSDSRVTAEELMGLSPGEVFVHRNVANMVPTVDLNSASVVEYAVRHLRVKHIIICGHYGCGGIKAAMTPQDFGLMNPWLRNIRDVYRTHIKELDEIQDERTKINRLIELNVQEQCINVIKMACVQERYVLEELPIVHGWVFDMANGKIIDLEIDFEKIMHSIQHIYDLTNSRWIMSRKQLSEPDTFDPAAF